MQTTESFFEFLELPENKGYMARMAAAYEGFGAMEPVSAITGGFNWAALPAESVVVDIGGGNGSLSFCLAQAIPHLRLVVQDRAVVISTIAKPVITSSFYQFSGHSSRADEQDWETAAKKGLIESGRVRLQGQS